MNPKFSGLVLLLDRSNINTDEIIPAKYLTYIEKEPLKSHLLEDLILDGFEPPSILWPQYNVILTRSNFGCGSSREMAVWAFEVNGISTIIASNFARIFRENAVNSGILPIELGEDSINQVFSTFAGSLTLEVEINFELQVLNFKTSTKNLELSFNLSSFDKAVVAHGGLVNFAVENY
ncbi:Methanogen homoaconitase small subunit [Candidatus Lokiarchaeum ossiferum]|uniref:Methanogen homoaconitase small subunit n=1 Tax=Candidatus Lokiarchaeum ossiferum TaxID=2951803 RepID=A0ABY6HT81_9ARCH|nr:Methanogen homoaconitase small subunit [Candidatus Lokiarchaeum sp. B-35]